VTLHSLVEAGLLVLDRDPDLDLDRGPDPDPDRDPDLDRASGDPRRPTGPDSLGR
jgi:hypothetical protein